VGLRHYVAASLLAVAFFALAVSLLRAGFNVSTPLVVVEGNSMLPTLYNGDLVLIHKPEPAEIDVGDIVVYRSPATGRLVIHRVIKVNIVKLPDGTLAYKFVTRGDNNPVDDVAQGLEPPGGIPYSDILGVVVALNINDGGPVPLRVPYLGLLTRALRG